MVEDCHFQFETLLSGLSTAPRMFTRVLAPVLGHLHTWGILTSEKAICFSALLLTESHLSHQPRGWKKGLTLDTIQVSVILPLDKCLALRAQMYLLKTNPSVFFCMKALEKMVTSFEAVPFTQFFFQAAPMECLSSMEEENAVVHFPNVIKPQHKTVSGLLDLLIDTRDGKIVPSLILEGLDDGCQPDELGWSSEKHLGPGNLVNAGEVVAHQHSGIKKRDS